MQSINAITLVLIFLLPFASFGQESKEKVGDKFVQDQLWERNVSQRGIQLAEAFFKHDAKMLRAYAPVMESAKKSTLRLIQADRQVAFATVVNSQGFAVTKASELDLSEKIFCRKADGTLVPATIHETNDVWDLAILKLEGDAWQPISWSPKSAEVGDFMIAVDVGSTPFSIGALSVLPRRLVKGFLGIQMRQTENGVRIDRITPNSAAEKAGLKPNDQVLSVDGESVSTSQELAEKIGKRRPGERLRISIKRGDQELSVEAELTERSLTLSPDNQRFGQLGIALNKRRTGFPVVLQTDIFLRPDQCGGPIVNLDGEVMGLNIARYDRITSYAIPATELRHLLVTDASGRPHFAKSMARLVKELAAAHKKVQETLSAFQQATDEYQKLQKELQQAASRD